MLGRHSTYRALREWIDFRFPQEPTVNTADIKKAQKLIDQRDQWKKQRKDIEEHPLVLSGGEEGKLQISLRAAFRDALRASVLAEIDSYILAIEQELIALSVEF